ncbi:hypothetical protein [Mastigocoleus testarum]|uniref:Uncharacterized protein n=1 Tax=Mastigocoleus testarum BC008 TaxID=371196 RepID=A0A0V7ZSD5_9CYAN|nr:hypothetical protein [Mastigocoleus testarum]KST67580.1 hypothetical protein BC008_30760 [Mastigocoleus testarum BC008]KST69784.1 hypothetical protein BC008_36090 [Mastigocoleus testarum BC008]
MTQSISDKISTLTKNQQKYADPPGLWIILFFSSVVLHLLAFWLLAQYKFSSDAAGSSSSVVPVELIRISSEKKSPVKLNLKPKPKLKSESQTKINSKPSSQVSRSQKLNSAPPSQKTKTDLENQDSSGVGVIRQQELAKQKLQQQIAEQKLEEKLLQQKLAQQKLQEQIAEQKRQEELIQQKIEQEKLAQQKLQEKIAEQKRQEELLKQKLAQQERQQQIAEQKPKNEFSDPQTDTSEQDSKNQISSDKTTENSSSETEDLPDPKKANNPSGNDLNNDLKGSTGEQEDLKNPFPNTGSDITTDGGKPLPESNIGGFVATWEIDRTALKKDIQDKAADITTRRKEFDLKGINSLSLSTENILEPTEFEAVIFINQDGSFNSLLAKPPEYQEYAEKIFQDREYVPAESGGRSPELSQILVKVKIMPRQP